MRAKKRPAISPEQREIELKERRERLSESGRVSCFLHHHYGWTKHNLKPYFAVLATHDFLTPENHTYEVATDTKTVVIRCKGGRPVFGGYMHDGELWFAVNYNIAPSYECIACGGTHVNHYSPFEPCWKCGKDFERETNFVHKNILVGTNILKAVS